MDTSLSRRTLISQGQKKTRSFLKALHYPLILATLAFNAYTPAYTKTLYMMTAVVPRLAKGFFCEPRDGRPLRVVYPRLFSFGLFNHIFHTDWLAPTLPTSNFKSNWKKLRKAGCSYLEELFYWMNSSLE